MTIETAVQAAFQEWMRRVPTDPAGAFPYTQWQPIVTTHTQPPVEAAYVEQAQQAADESGIALPAAVLAAAVLTYINGPYAQLTANTHIPDRVLDVLTRTGTRPAASDPLWTPMLDVFAENLLFRTLNSATYAAVPNGAFIRWQARSDSRTRPTHTDASGQLRPKGVPFSVGGYPLRFPHDPLGPPQETVNCRCRLTIVRN